LNDVLGKPTDEEVDEEDETELEAESNTEDLSTPLMLNLLIYQMNSKPWICGVALKL